MAHASAKIALIANRLRAFGIADAEKIAADGRMPRDAKIDPYGKGWLTLPRNSTPLEVAEWVARVRFNYARPYHVDTTRLAMQARSAAA